MEEKVRAKKHLGQHFLKDENIARKIVASLKPEGRYEVVLEIGPGMGVLTKYLLREKSFNTHVVEIDRESINYLKKHYPEIVPKLHMQDFLEMDLHKFFPNTNLGIIGNFPYNISSQIIFKVLEHKDQIPEVVGMFQKEVAERIATKPGSKTYGILSVLTQAWYTIEYLFTVNETVFSPPPKVKSAVIRLSRNKTKELGCDEELFRKVVKTAFNQRRKQLRNAIRPLIQEDRGDHELLSKRAEQLSVRDFVTLTNWIKGK